MLASLLL
ncbi:hypothetical protein MAR_023494 [Mya arenaria]|nr:hypothetical protein MAR_023494 [Mya arenaria]